MHIIKKEYVEQAIGNGGRVYLCGDLEAPNAIRNITVGDYEVGITYYSEFTFEKAHLHRFNKEFNYVIDGELKVLLLKNNHEYHFNKGDFFVIDTNEPYVCKAISGTKTYFSKYPGGNDKQYIDVGKSVLKWGSSWESEYEEN